MKVEHGDGNDSRIMTPVQAANAAEDNEENDVPDERYVVSPVHLPSGPLRAGWSRPQPEHLSEPTYWPVVMALGITMLLWGFVTTWIITLVGLALFVLAISGWIGELLHENPEE